MIDRRSTLAVAGGIAAVVSGACADETAGRVSLPPPVVGVMQALTATVAGEARFVGTLQAVQRVELRVRVQGSIEDKFFIDGQDVTEGQKLF